MSYLSIRPISMALCCLIGLGLGGCTVNGRPYVSAGYVYGGPASMAYYDYWYYPGVSVYYDIHRHVYFYLTNGNWVQVRVLPPALRARLGHHVTVRSRHERPYMEYNSHRREYPANRYTPPVKKIPEQRRYQPQTDRYDSRREQNRYDERYRQQYERTHRSPPAQDKNAKRKEKSSPKGKGNSNKYDRNDRGRSDNKSRKSDQRDQYQQYPEAPRKY